MNTSSPTEDKRDAGKTYRVQLSVRYSDGTQKEFSNVVKPQGRYITLAVNQITGTVGH